MRSGKAGKIWDRQDLEKGISELIPGKANFQNFDILSPLLTGTCTDGWSNMGGVVSLSESRTGMLQE